MQFISFTVDRGDFTPFGGRPAPGRPRLFSPDGRSLTIDAVPDGNRQIYQYDVSSIVG